MKALSLWQPWAQLIVIGGKSIETRHWPTKVRGKIAVHAARRETDRRETDISFNITDLPLGAVVGTVEIIDCFHIEELYGSKYDTPMERSYGDWAKGRFGWVLSDPTVFEIPIKAPGHQGFWQWNDSGQ